MLYVWRFFLMIFHDILQSQYTVRQSNRKPVSCRYPSPFPSMFGGRHDVKGHLERMEERDRETRTVSHVMPYGGVGL
uniref:Putative secreted protein n=1 Tax=Anopheles marajoara TaxID=58244 RepID=A0A2M4CCW5_9DIPT